MGVLLQRSHADRETMSHLILTREEGPQVGLQIWAGQTMLTGTFITDHDIEGQLLELEASGLVGGLARTSTPQQQVIQLWSADEEQRQAWTARMTRATTSPEGWTLLSAAGEWRWAQWRKDQAWERVQAAIVDADRAGIPKKVIAEIAGIRRGAVYEAVDTRPAPNEAPAPPTPSRSLVESRPAPTLPNGAQPAPGQLVRMPREKTMPCVMCGTPPWNCSTVRSPSTRDSA